MTRESMEYAIEQIREGYKKWNDVYLHGTMDAMTDGVCLNVARATIIVNKQQCKEYLSEEDLPEEYYWKTPPEMDNNYMLNVEEIKYIAPIVLQKYETDENYLWLKEHRKELTDEQVEKSRIDYVLSTVDTLRKAIEDDNVFSMKVNAIGVYETPADGCEEFRQCRLKVSGLLGEV